MNTNDWQTFLYIFLKLIFAITIVLCTTFLSWHFNNHRIMWWYMAAILAYLAI